MSRAGLGYKGENRPVILAAAEYGGWSRDTAEFDGGDIIRDLFSSQAGTVRVVWIRTPWGTRFGGAVFSDRGHRKQQNVWTLGGRRGLRGLLHSGSFAE